MQGNSYQGPKNNRKTNNYNKGYKSNNMQGNDSNQGHDHMQNKNMNAGRGMRNNSGNH